MNKKHIHPHTHTQRYYQIYKHKIPIERKVNSKVNHITNASPEAEVK